MRTLAIWLAAVHDVGKISPAFAVQVYDGAPGLLDLMRRHGLVVRPGIADDGDRSRVRHEFVGQDAVRGWLRDELGFAYKRSAAQLACVVGGHHGVPSADGDIALVRGRPDLAGEGPWAAARAAVLTGRPSWWAVRRRSRRSPTPSSAAPPRRCLPQS